VGTGPAISDLNEFNIVAGAFGQLDRLSPRPGVESSTGDPGQQDRLQLLAAVEALELASRVVFQAGGGRVAANAPSDVE
jgi:hypothetical protein